MANVPGDGYLQPVREPDDEVPDITVGSPDSFHLRRPTPGRTVISGGVLRGRAPSGQRVPGVPS